MPTVKNMNYGPLSISRADKDPLTLGPRETADISDLEFESEEIQRHLRDRRISVLPGATRSGGGGGRPRSNEGRGSGTSTPTPTE